MKRAQKPSQLRKEILSVLLFTFCLAMFLSLISYSPDDPSFSFYNTNPQKIHNLLGVAGSFLSDLMLKIFGLSSFLLVLIIFHFSIRLFLTLQTNLTFVKSISWLGLFFASAGMLDLGLGKVSLGKFSGGAGGFLGQILSTFLIKYLNIAGAYIFLALVLLLSLMSATNFSFFSMGNCFLRVFSSLKKWLVSLLKNKKIFPPLGKKGKPYQKEFLRKEDPSPSPLKESDSYQFPKEPTIVTDSLIGASLPAKVNNFTQSKQSLSPGFKLPPLTLLQEPKKRGYSVERGTFIQNSRLLENKLGDYGVQAKVVNVHPGPVITRYELEPAPGVKINRIVNLADDLALALRAIGIRIIAPIPEKAVIGVEIPNKNRETVYFKEVVAREEFLQSGSPLTLALGKDIAGTPIITDLSNMPHLLIAGTTGSGKSVFLNAVICSILFKALPSEVKLLIMDPKRSELTFYKDIPHLLYPVVTNAKQAAEAIRWLVEEMERRYHLLAKRGVRDIRTYNEKAEKLEKDMPIPIPDSVKNEAASLDFPQQIPWIVVVIDELANLMMVSSRDVEWSLARLAQMARAAGIHLLVATQRPSVDVITGTIKANFPARISFRLATKTDSRIIIDTNGAENLLNQGDMLFLSPRTARLKRIHGPYITDDEIVRVVDFLKSQGRPEYQELRLTSPDEGPSKSFEDTDEKYQEAVALVTSIGQASISLIQRKLRIGYNRAARIIEKMEEDGIVGPSDGIKPREVLKKMVDI